MLTITDLDALAAAAGDRDREAVEALLALEEVADERGPIVAVEPLDPAAILCAPAASVSAGIVHPVRRTLARAWMTPEVCLYALPDGEQLQLVAAGPDLLLPVLASLLAVGPRPRAGDSWRLTVREPQLAAALALGPAADPASVATALQVGDGEDNTPLVELVRDGRAWFTATAAWRDAAGRRGSRTAAALDKPGRPLWLVSELGDDWLICAPSTPTAWFRRLAALLPSPEELAASSGDLTH